MSGDDHDAEEVAQITDPAELEHRQVSGAIRTDFILSAEIMAIALSDLTGRSLGMQAAILAAVAIAITVGVYGVVALIVKMDDIGLHLAKRRAAGMQLLGRILVNAMPPLLSGLSLIGTAAMIWVGGGIIVHGLEVFGLDAVAHWIHDAAEASAHAVGSLPSLVEWIVGAAGAAVVGMIVGAPIVAVMHRIRPH